MKLVQSGRSMVEMLAVLAISGILLSVGVISFQYLIDTWKLNNINTRLSVATSSIYPKLNRLGNNNISLQNFVRDAFKDYNDSVESEFCSENSNSFRISIPNITKGLCQRISKHKKANGDYNLNASSEVPIYVYQGTGCPAVIENIVCENNNEIVFLFDIANRRDKNYCVTATDCSEGQNCEDNECVCQTACGVDEAKNPICCAEGYYCGTTTNSSSTYECLAEQACPEDCLNTTSWTTGTVEVQYCQDTNESCRKANPSSCASITVTCGTEGTGRQYCYNTNYISWWNAKSICKALGMRLPTVDELVTGWKNSSDSRGEHFTRTPFAENMNGIMGGYYVWSSILYNSCYAWHVFLGSGSTDNFGRDGSYRRLLCVQ